MSTRICPTCNEYLSDFDNYFCSVCGSELPEKLTKLPGTIKIREFDSLRPVFTFSRKKKKKLEDIKSQPKHAETTSITQRTQQAQQAHKASFNQKMGIVLGIVVIGLLVFFAGFYFYLNSRPVAQVAVSTAPKQKYAKAVNVGLTSKSAEFDTFSALDYAPADSQFYAEIADLDYFAQNLVSADLLELSIGDYLKLQSLVKKEGFAVFAFPYLGKTYWAAVFVPQNKKTLQEEILSIKSPKFKFRVIGDRLVVFQNNASDNVMKTVEGVYNGQILKISLNPDYVTKVANLNTQGQMRVLVLNPSESAILVEQLSANYFSSQAELFAKLVGLKSNAFVVNNK